MIVSYSLHILGQIVNTCHMDIETPPKFITEVSHTLCFKWGLHQRVFLLQDIKSLTMKLGHIASTTLWLQFLLQDLYVLITHCALTPSTPQPPFHQQQAILCPPQNPGKQKALYHHCTDTMAHMAIFIHLFQNLHFNTKNLHSGLALIINIVNDHTIKRRCPITLSHGIHQQ